MTVAITNFSDLTFSESRYRLNESARRFGINTIFSYSDEDIRQSAFYRENEAILSLPRGAGYWLWKPYIILESLKKMAEGDIVLYADSGIEIIADIQPLIQICAEEQPVVLFANGNLINAEWTKRDCFILTDCDFKACYRARQADGAFSLYRKTKYTLDFVEKWLEYGRDPRMFTDMKNTLGKRNSWRFIEHRHDQSVLSIMAFTSQLPYYRMPTQFGNHYKAPAFRVAGEFNCVNQKRPEQVSYYSTRFFDNSPYFQLLNQHRLRSIQTTPKKRSFMKKIESRLRKWL